MTTSLLQKLSEFWYCNMMWAKLLSPKLRFFSSQNRMLKQEITKTKIFYCCWGTTLKCSWKVISWNIKDSFVIQMVTNLPSIKAKETQIYIHTFNIHLSVHFKPFSMLYDKLKWTCTGPLGFFDISRHHMYSVPPKLSNLHLYFVVAPVAKRYFFSFISGVLYHRWTKYPAAEKAYKESLVLDPNNMSTRENLKMLRLAMAGK